MISIDDKLIIGLECCLNKDNTIDCAACPFNGKSDETGKTCKQIVWEALKDAKADILGNKNNDQAD